VARGSDNAGFAPRNLRCQGAQSRGGTCLPLRCVYDHNVNISELEFLVLVSLSNQARHGYGILLDVIDVSGGSVKPQVATLYRQLERLERDGLVIEDHNEVVDGRFRRYYRLTETGRTCLSDAVALRAATARTAQRRLRLATPSRSVAGGAA
jgi:PadR family transcriptional regulator, regulatory protein PadR